MDILKTLLITAGIVLLLALTAAVFYASVFIAGVIIIAIAVYAFISASNDDYPDEEYY